MSSIEKRLEKLYRKPVPNDITFHELESIAKYFGCIVDSGGNHSKIIYKGSFNKVIPIPRHKKTVDEVYIIQFKQLLEQIKEANSQ